MAPDQDPPVLDIDTLKALLAHAEKMSREATKAIEVTTAERDEWDADAATYRRQLNRQLTRLGREHVPTPPAPSSVTNGVNTTKLGDTQAALTLVMSGDPRRDLRYMNRRSAVLKILRNAANGVLSSQEIHDALVTAGRTDSIHGVRNTLTDLKNRNEIVRVAYGQWAHPDNFATVAAAGEKFIAERIEREKSAK